MNEFEIIRGAIDGKEKYCRIPIRSKIAETMVEDGKYELSADAILSMPREQAARTIDAIMQDWLYWLKRANELYVLLQGSCPPEGDRGQHAELG
jgi:hypothetical protein